jgi:hypothetical protein
LKYQPRDKPARRVHETIFGEDACSAAVLMEADSSGKLDRLTAAFKASDDNQELVKVAV